MKELDLLLRQYLDHHWSEATSGERDVFARLLELPDPELASYLLGHAAAADPSLEPTLEVLRGLSARRAGGGSVCTSGSGAQQTTPGEPGSLP